MPAFAIGCFGFVRRQQTVKRSTVTMKTRRHEEERFVQTLTGFLRASSCASSFRGPGSVPPCEVCSVRQTTRGHRRQQTAKRSTVTTKTRRHEEHTKKNVLYKP